MQTRHAGWRGPVFLVNSRTSWLCDTALAVVLLVKLTDAVCRVPYAALPLRHSVLHLRTCVGLGHGFTFFHVRLSSETFFNTIRPLVQLLAYTQYIFFPGQNKDVMTLHSNSSNSDILRDRFKPQSFNVAE